MSEPGGHGHVEHQGHADTASASSDHVHPHAPGVGEHVHASQAWTTHSAAMHADHPHDHEHSHSHVDHIHEHSGLLGHLPFFHKHSHGEMNVDSALESSRDGLRTLILSLLLLGVTAASQLVIALLSGSVGLLADTIHNAGDALTAVPLGVAFYVGRRPPNRRYTYGYGRAEDLAGVLIVLIILASALISAVESIARFMHPQPLTQAGWVIAAALVGFAGNETVAELRMRTGRRIGSAALEADGQHARVDGFTSLAVLVGAVATLAGLQIADPIVGLFITIVILFVVRDSARTMWHRLMDAVDEDLIDGVQTLAGGVPGVVEVTQVRARFVGHQLLAELRIGVDGAITAAAAHAIAEDVHHALLHGIPRLAEAQVHVDPSGDEDPHAALAHHAPGLGAPQSHR
jgi:cation diffusion facilitator family transporter